MKVVILAGGFGTRFAEETDIKPKPMIEIGGKPILWHIMKIYEQQGFNDFVVCLGYKGEVIKEYFLNYFINQSNVKVDLEKNKVEILNTSTESFKITLVNTGLNSKTAERIKRIQPFLNPNEDFMLTYGDGVSDVSIKDLLSFHREHNKIATVTSIQPLGRFGVMEIDANGQVKQFKEKNKEDEGWINAGYFVLKPEVFNYLEGDMNNVMWEDAPMASITQDNQLMAFKHNGFWKCMDALRDKIELENMWNTNNAQWKKWK